MEDRKEGVRTMADQSSRNLRKLRADAQRNHERVLDAAREVFNMGGVGASLEAVARRAGVGIGTVYRHFPTRDALLEAVYCCEVQQLVTLAEQLWDTCSPLAALRRWVRALIDIVAMKKGTASALTLVAQGQLKLSSGMMEQMTHALGGLLQRAAIAGAIRSDVGPEETLRALLGICYMQDSLDWRRTVIHLTEIFIDGLSQAGAAAATEKD
jgi:AcrR family transcriptional regulator